MQAEDNKMDGSLLIAIVSVVLQAIAWIMPNAVSWVRVSISILSVVLILFSQRSSYEGFRAWLAALLTYLIANYPLALAALLSGAVILGFPNIPNPDLLSKMRFVMVAILAASLCSLVLGRGRQPSVRIVKGSSDKVYLIEDSTKRHIPDPLTHDFIMLDTYRQTERISDLELRLYPMGKPLPKVSECRLVKGGGPAQYVVWEGRRKHIPDEPTAEHFFQGRQPEKISDIDLEEIPRTGGLRSILASAGVDLSITINAGEGSRARANQSTSASQQRLVILSSVYGKDATMIDVTETVKSKVVAGRLELTVSTENLLVEDPLPRVRKELRIEYTFAGEPHIRVFRERWKCSIP